MYKLLLYIILQKYYSCDDLIYLCFCTFLVDSSDFFLNNLRMSKKNTTFAADLDRPQE